MNATKEFIPENAKMVANDGVWAIGYDEDGATIQWPLDGNDRDVTTMTEDFAEFGDGNQWWRVENGEWTCAERDEFVCDTCGETLPMSHFDHRFDQTDQNECLDCGQRILDEEEEEEEENE